MSIDEVTLVDEKENIAYWVPILFFSVGDSYEELRAATTASQEIINSGELFAGVVGLGLYSFHLANKYLTRTQRYSSRRR